MSDWNQRPGQNPLALPTAVAGPKRIRPPCRPESTPPAESIGRADRRQWRQRNPSGAPTAVNGANGIHRARRPPSMVPTESIGRADRRQWRKTNLSALPTPNNPYSPPKKNNPKTMQNIATINSARMSAALHVQFHTAVLTHIENQGSATAGLDKTLVEAYKQAIAEEQDYVNRPLASPYTARIQELDQTRDALVDDILGRLRGARVSPDATAKAAYASLKLQILDRYPATMKAENYQRETALIQGLLVDLEKVDEQVLKALGLDALTAELTTVNQRFTKVYLARNTERVEQGATDLVRLRSAVDDLYAQLAAQLTYIANRSDAALAALEGTEQEKASALRLTARRALAELNEHIAYYKTHYLGGKPTAADEATDGSATGGDGTDDDTSDGDDGSAKDDASGGKPSTGPTDVTEVL